MQLNLLLLDELLVWKQQKAVMVSRPRVEERKEEGEFQGKGCHAHLCTAKSDLFPTSTIGTASLPV